MAPSAAPSRNTLNQRAARARRKTYVGELERRLRDYEAHGVRATEQVQTAARLVAEQNHALRDEVRALRERCAALEGLLAAMSTSTPTPTPYPSTDGVPRPRKPALQVSRKGYPSPSPTQDQHGPSPTQNQHGPSSTSIPSPMYSHPGLPSSIGAGADAGAEAETDEMETDEEEGVDCSDGPCTSHHHDRDDHGHYHYRHEDDDNDNTHDHNHPNADPGTDLFPPLTLDLNHPNSTSCAQAALIIASMRGLGATDADLRAIEAIEADILPELGCVGVVEPWPVDTEGVDTSNRNHNHNRKHNHNHNHNLDPNPNPNRNPHHTTNFNPHVTHIAAKHPPAVSGLKWASKPPSSLFTASKSTITATSTSNTASTATSTSTATAAARQGCKYQQARLCAIDNTRLFGILDREAAASES
ncbi:hypothetical protein A1O3_07632 [Capronia epimyces CBS 606.96]|uniref:BZIP domain-containing protein n=1 Tax=Capronia epimyces CBS 606.96 TaxID=1182542 RepID=W9XLH2_9EURO|nr:uncharacterized protein A1O3_07632 [Capronia epimyces CBS 606.96]EXJ81342.1 hypothetical protein A1O3_07632 [Capronia epimyces CBS 606.96]